MYGSICPDSGDHLDPGMKKKSVRVSKKKRPGIVIGVDVTCIWIAVL